MEIGQALSYVAYLLPAILVGIIAYYFFKGHTANEEGRRRYLIQKEAQKNIIPIRLQAYERLTLFLERIDPSKLLIRVKPNSDNLQEYESLLIQNIENSRQELLQVVSNSKTRRVAYFIWNNPLMAAGQGTFINEMLNLNRMVNVFEADRYPETDLDTLKTMEINEILLSSEPFPFEEKHKKTFSGISEKVTLVDGEYFSWYGSRVLKALKYFRQFHS